VSGEVAQSGEAVSDAAGVATVIVRGPHRTGTRWALRTVVVVSQRVGDGTYPVATVYRGVVDQHSALGTSRAADRVTFNAAGDWLLAGDQLIIVITNTAPATRAVVSLTAVEQYA
jgi:hypothetical protein